MTVYVVQNQHRLDGNSLTPKFDFEPARSYGELVFLLGPTANPFNPGHVVRELQDKLVGFSNDDFLLLVGNPILIGWACAIASFYNHGRVACLQFNGREKRYLAVVADIEPLSLDC